MTTAPLLLVAAFAAPLEARKPPAFVPPAPAPPRRAEDIRREEDEVIARIDPAAAERRRTFDRITGRILPVIKSHIWPYGRGDVEIQVLPDRIVLGGWVTGRFAKDAVERATRDAAEGRVVDSRLVAIRMYPVVARKPEQATN